MDNNNNNQSDWVKKDKPLEIKDAQTSMILGIVGLFLTLSGGCFPAGFVMGIIAVIKARKAEKMYQENPSAYFGSDLQPAKAGKITGIISIVLSSLGFLVLIGYIILIVALGVSGGLK